MNYWIDIPPGFSAVAETPDGKGGVTNSPSGDGILKIWAVYLGGSNFKQVVLATLASDRAAGWSITSQETSPTSLAWTGVNKRRSFAERAIHHCGNAVAFYRLEFDRNATSSYAPIISHLDESLDNGSCW